MPPPELAGDAPVLDIFQPVVIDFFPAFGKKPDQPVAHGGAGLRSLRVFQKPLFRETWLDRNIGALAEADIIFVRFFLHQDPEFAEFVHRLNAGLKPVKLRKVPAREFVHCSVRIQDVDDRQIVAQADFVVGPVVCGGDLEDAGAEFELHRVVADDGQDCGIVQWKRPADVKADEILVARILRVNRNRRVAHDRFRAGRGNFQKCPRPLHDLDFEMIEITLLWLRDDLLIAERRERDRAPVHHPLAAIDQTFFVQVHENLLHFAGVGVVHREALALPVARAAEFFKLLDDDAAVLFLPFPDTLEELLAAEVMAGFLFFLAELSLDNRLRGDAGMVGARKPQDLVAGLPGVAGEDVLDRVV